MKEKKQLLEAKNHFRINLIFLRDLHAQTITHTYKSGCGWGASCAGSNRSARCTLHAQWQSFSQIFAKGQVFAIKFPLMQTRMHTHIHAGAFVLICAYMRANKHMQMYVSKYIQYPISKLLDVEEFARKSKEFNWSHDFAFAAIAHCMSV